MADKLNEYMPDYLVTPGEMLKEYIESFGMTQAELAVRTGLANKTINEIIKGKSPITSSTSLKLERALGRPAHFWNNLEAQYQEQLARAQERERMEADVEWLKNIPVKELADRNIISRRRDKPSQLREVLGFYGVSSVAAWHKLWAAPAVAARRSSCFETRQGPASAWLRLGELRAHEIDCQPFDKGRFKAALLEIRGLTRERPKVFQPKMIRLCAEAGVAVVFVREMKKAPWNGATKWLNSQKVMVLLSLRGKSEDKFWFSFFHEAGHVLYDNKRELLINDGNPQNDPREQRADKFAADTLISEKYNARIISIRTKAELRTLAAQLGVSPGIVAGRYQHLTNKWTWFKDQIRTLNWAESTT